MGKRISEMVRSVPGLDAFFAEEVQNLTGLENSILQALHRCDAFITVLHDRGTVARPDGPAITRASVWIEQEIAIAAYIQHVERRAIPIIVFKHRSVGIEGLRSLLHINAITFTHESEILDALPKLLQDWRGLPPSGIRLQLESALKGVQDGHTIRFLRVMLFNDTDQRITEFTCRFSVPDEFLSHDTAHYFGEIRPSKEFGRRMFEITEKGSGGPNQRTIGPRDSILVMAIPYCMTCAMNDIAQVVVERKVKADAWIGGRSYHEEKMFRDLNKDPSR